MSPADVFRVLKGIGVQNLHHANTVSTSCTFLEHGALLSRGCVERHGLSQTAQASDEIDKKFGIWDRVFVDHVDIHFRGGRVKGPNQYGPVLFVLDLNVLLGLPAGSDVLVAKMNPIHWRNGQVDSDRWFLTPEELARNINYGDFEKMIVIQSADGRVKFPSTQISIALDDSKRMFSSGQDAYANAAERLRRSAKAGGIEVVIDKHACKPDCKCIQKYQGYGQQYFDALFL